MDYTYKVDKVAYTAFLSKPDFANDMLFQFNLSGFLEQIKTDKYLTGLQSMYRDYRVKAVTVVPIWKFVMVQEQIMNPKQDMDYQVIPFDDSTLRMRWFWDTEADLPNNKASINPFHAAKSYKKGTGPCLRRNLKGTYVNDQLFDYTGPWNDAPKFLFTIGAYRRQQPNKDGWMARQVVTHWLYGYLDNFDIAYKETFDVCVSITVLYYLHLRFKNPVVSTNVPQTKTLWGVQGNNVVKTGPGESGAFPVPTQRPMFNKQPDLRRRRRDVSPASSVTSDPDVDQLFIDTDMSVHSENDSNGFDTVDNKIVKCTEIVEK